jgi:hypothetical protein
MRRYKIKEIICEDPTNVVHNITFYSKDGSVLGVCHEGTIRFRGKREFISFTFEGKMCLEEKDGNFCLVKIDE